MNAIELKNITRYFEGVRALSGISVGIQKGAVTGLVGPNGSGKTTMLNIVSGLVAPDGGVMRIAGGREMRRMRPREARRRGIARSFQEIRLFEQMTVFDNIAVVLAGQSVRAALTERGGTERARVIEETLRRVGVWEKRNQRAETLSYGQRKLVEIARVLAVGADICLLDEPFAGLFPEMKEVVTAIIREMKERGKTVALIEHDMGVIRRLSDRIIVLDGGEVIAEGAPEAVLAKKEVVGAYLGK